MVQPEEKYAAGNMAGKGPGLAGIFPLAGICRRNLAGKVVRQVGGRKVGGRQVGGRWSKVKGRLAGGRPVNGQRTVAGARGNRPWKGGDRPPWVTSPTPIYMGDYHTS